MDRPQDVFDRAGERAARMQLAYAGAVTPKEAHALLDQVPGTRMIDVRTRAEWDWVGHVPDAILVEWNTYPGGQRNPSFAEQLRDAVPDLEIPLLFLCRSGGRSHAAASVAASLGYVNAYNILEGFEGDKDAYGHRGKTGGWKFAGLPWVQG